MLMLMVGHQEEHLACKNICRSNPKSLSPGYPTVHGITQISGPIEQKMIQ